MRAWRVAMIIIVAAMAGAALAQQHITVGPWTATVGDSDLENLTYNGETVITRGGLRGFLPAWKGERFSLADGELTVTDTGAVWHCNDLGNQEATVTLELTPTTVRYSLNTTVTSAGPSEWWIQLAPESVRTSEDHATVRVNGALRTLLLSSLIDNINGISEMRFEQPERTVVLRCSNMQMQDRRTRGGGLFFVRVLGSNGDQPREFKQSFELEVIQADPATLEGRRAFLSQRSVRETEIKLSNADFETGDLEKWTHGPISSVDTEVFHSGAASARTSLQSAEGFEGNGYIIQTAPATAGRLYRVEAWVKGENVKPATVNGMSAAGATVIVEFSDRQGAWLAAGGYGPKTYGTFGWRKMTTPPAKAPDAVGRAIIYLALRATGTVWFDDVRLVEVEYPISLMAPMEQATVHDNTPRFDWYYEPKVLTSIEISASPDFPADDTTVVADVTPPLQIETPLAPGTWYWRVRDASGDTVSDTWRFEQTATLAEDTTDPAIAECHAWLARANAAMVIRYSDNVGVAKVSLTVDGEDVSDGVRMSERSARYTPDKPWTAGLHRAHVVVEDAAGNSAERDLFFTHTKPLPTTEWLRTGGVAVDGERHFLLGMYGINEEYMPEMAAAGIDYVHSYRWDGSGTTEEALAYLDAAQASGLQVFMGLQRSKLIAGDEEFVAERVAALMAHPALLCWYLFDEPDLKHQYVSPPELARLYRLIKALDPFHPVVVTCAGDAPVPLYADAMDVHWSQVYRDPTYVSGRLERHRAALPEGFPISAILHCYDRAQSGLPEAERDPAKFQPDGHMMRANAFMALAHDASCLSWWWWGYGGSNRAMTVANAPDAWTSLKQTFADIRSLRPLLTADGEVHRSVIEAGDAEVHVWEKRLADRTVVIAVNRDDVECEAAIPLTTVPNDATMTVLFEGGAAQIQDGVLNARFGPLDVHVYELH